MGINFRQRIAVTTFLLGLAMILIGLFSGGSGMVLSGVALLAGSVAIYMLKQRIGGTVIRPLVDTEKLTYSEKLSRLRIRLRDPQWRRYGILLLAGNTLGIALLFALISVGSPLVRSAWDWGTTVAHAQQPEPAAAATTPAYGGPQTHTRLQRRATSLTR